MIHHPGHPTPAASKITAGFDARAKLCATLALLAAIVTSPLDATWTYVYFAVFLVLSLSASGIPLRAALKRSLIIAPLLLGLALAAPFLPHEPGELHPYERLAGAAWKAWLGVLCAIWLGAATAFPDLLTGLARLRVPPLLILMTGFIYRYLFLIGEELARTRRAMAARGFRMRRLLQARQLGGVAGALFLRCHARAERTHFAMLARGYRGGAVHPARRRLAARDFLFIAGALACAIGLRWLPG